MKILAIDPGSEKSGYVILDGSHIDSGVGENRGLIRLVRGCAHSCDWLTVEQIGHYGTGMPAGRTVFDTCIWIGRFIQAWLDSGRSGDTCRLILRPTIKTHFCGTARAKDANVRQALMDRLGKPGTKRQPGPTYGVSSHAWQALALALYVSDMERIAA